MDDTEIYDANNIVIKPDPEADLAEDFAGLGFNDGVDFSDGILMIFRDEEEKEEEKEEEEPAAAPATQRKRKRKYQRAVKFSCETSQKQMKEELLYPPQYPTPHDIIEAEGKIEDAVPRGWWVDQERMKDQATATCDATLMDQTFRWGLKQINLADGGKVTILKSKLKDFHSE